MRNFVITVNGKSYEVGVEEVGATASAPVVTQVSAPAPAASTSAPAAPVCLLDFDKGDMRQKR